MRKIHRGLTRLIDLIMELPGTKDQELSNQGEMLDLFDFALLLSANLIR